MAIDLLNRLTQAQMNTTVSKQVVEAVKNADSAEAARILNTVLSLKAGDTLQGELVSINGKDISLLLGNTVLLSAKMEKELVLTQGQKMSFTVNSNQNGKLSLKPLFANTGMEQNAMKALDAASIPVTDKTLALVEELMRQGMPVNKQMHNHRPHCENGVAGYVFTEDGSDHDAVNRVYTGGCLPMSQYDELWERGALRDQ